MGDIPKGAMLKGLEHQMYQDYKVSEYAAGRTPASLDDWKKTLSSNKPSKPKEQSNIEYGFPEQKRVKDSKKINKKLNEIWEKDDMPRKQVSYEKAAQELGIVADTVRSYVYSKRLEGNAEGVYLDSIEEYKKTKKPLGRTKKELEIEEKKEVIVEPKKDIVPGVTSKSETFTLTKEELLEFGKAAFERGRNSVQTLSEETKDNLLDEICLGKVS